MAQQPLSASLQEWEQRLNQLDPTRIELGLDRVRQVKSSLFDTVSLPPVLLIAGTNGKGSTAALCQAALLEAGHAVGTYTSPHLVSISERILINGEHIDDTAFVAALNEVDQARGDTPLTYFEFITLAAVVEFARCKVDVALLEVGLGGRLDAVNVFDPVASCVTNVGLDHMDWLGGTREKIGIEKAGVFRKGIPAIYADDKPVSTVIEHAEAIGADLQIYNTQAEDFAAPNMTGVPRTIRWCAKQLLESLPKSVRPTAEAVKAGFAKAQLQGRYQTVCTEPLVIVDVAHNAEATGLLAEKLVADDRADKWVAVFAAYKDKPVAQALGPMMSLIGHWYCCQLQSPRALQVEALCEEVEAQGGRASSVASVVNAVKQAVIQVRDKKSGVIVFGSFETVGLAMTSLKGN